MMRTQPTFLVGSIFTNKSISDCQHLQGTKPIEWDQHDNCNSTATAVRAAVALSITLKLPRYDKTNWNSFNFWPAQSADSHLNLNFYIIFGNGGDYGTVSSCISKISARAVTCTTTAIWHRQWKSGWAGLTVILSLPCRLRRRADSKLECPSPELDCQQLQPIRLK
jgi:hypothetical protein